MNFPNSLTEQATIAKKYDELKAETTRLAALYERKLALLAELKQSLLAKAFSGQLTVDSGQLAIDAAGGIDEAAAEEAVA